MTQRGVTNRRTGAAAAAALLSLAACGADETSTAESGTGEGGGEVTSLSILDYHTSDPHNSTYQELFETCGEESGVTIDRVSVPGGDLISRVLQQSSSRTLPDILMLDNPEVQQIAATGALAPLGQFGITAEGYAEGVVEAATYEGELYALQPVTNSIGLFYNEDMLAEAGVAPPTTWDEFKTAAAQLTEGNRYGVAFSAINTFEGSWQFLPFMWSNGGDETEINTPEVAEALQLWVDLVDSGSASSSVVNWTQLDVKDQFAAGNAAMMINGPWQFPVLDEVEGLNYAVVSIPTPDGASTIAPLGGDTWTLPETGDSARQAVAAEVLKCVHTDENIVANGIQRGLVPTQAELADEVVAENPKLEVFAALVPDLRARTGQLGEEWPAAATDIYEAVQLALTGVAPEQALQQATGG